MRHLWDPRLQVLLLTTHKATLEAKKRWPRGTLVFFFDTNQAERLGKVVNHARGKIVLLSPPPNDYGTARRWRVAADDIKEVYHE